MIYDYAIDNTSKEEAKEVEGNAIGGIEGGKPELFDAAPAQDLGGGDYLGVLPCYLLLNKEFGSGNGSGNCKGKGRKSENSCPMRWIRSIAQDTPVDT